MHVARRVFRSGLLLPLCSCRFALKLTNELVQKEGPSLSWQSHDDVYDSAFESSVSLAIACKMVRCWERQVESHEGCTKCCLFSDSNYDREDASQDEEDDSEEKSQDEEDDGNDL